MSDIYLPTENLDWKDKIFQFVGMFSQFVFLNSTTDFFYLERGQR